MTSPSLKRWIANANKIHRAPAIYTLVFGLGGLRYFLYRTRFQGVNVVVRLALHILEYFLIFHTMPGFLLTAMMLRVGAIAVEAGWWGILDIKRQRIRRHQEKRDSESIRGEIEHWLMLSQLLSVMVLGVGIALLFLLDPSLTQGVLIGMIALQLCIRLILRTLYSGVYAVRRVYIRFEWIVGSELAVFALAWFTHPTLGEWTLPLTLLVSSLLSSGISYFFIRRTMEFMRLQPRQLFRPISLMRIRKQYSIETLWPPGLAMISTRIHDVVLILSLQHVQGQAADSTLLFAFYLMIPLIRNAMNWSQIIYFDLTRNMLDAFQGFRSYVERQAGTYGMYYNAAMTLIAGIALALALPEGLPLLGPICVYLLLGSLLGLVYISLFARKHYGIVTLLAWLQYALLAGLSFNNIAVLGIFIFSLSIPALLGLIYLYTHRMAYSDSEQSYLQWVYRISREERPLELLVITLDDKISPSLRNQFSQRLQEFFGHRIILCYRRNSFLIGYIGGTALTEDTRSRLISLSAGMISSIEAYTAENGKSALAWLGKGQFSGTIPLVANLEQMEQEFKTIFPTGEIQRPTIRNPRLSGISQEEREGIVKNAIAVIEGQKQRSDSEWFTTAIQHDGWIEAIFLVRKSQATPQLRQQWLLRLERYTLASDSAIS